MKKIMVLVLTVAVQSLTGMQRVVMVDLPQLQEGAADIVMQELVAEEDALTRSDSITIEMAQKIVDALDDTVLAECAALVEAYGKDGVFFGPVMTNEKLKNALNNPVYVLGLIKQGANPVPAERLGKQKTALHLAALRGNAAIVAILLSNMPRETVSAVDRQKHTALHFAAREGHRGCVELLLRCMEPSEIILLDRSGKSAWHLAYDEDMRTLLVNTTASKLATVGEHK